MFRRRRSWLGLFLALIGIVLARQVSTMVSPGEWSSAVYLLGVALALGGLALVASAIQVTSVSVVPCPRCYLVNPVEAERCARCAAPLHKEDEDKGL